MNEIRDLFPGRMRERTFQLKARRDAGAVWHEPQFVECKQCGRRATRTIWTRSLYVCPNCGYHMPIGGYYRLSLVLDHGSFRELDADLPPQDVLRFPGYPEKLTAAQNKTGLREAAVTATGRISSTCPNLQNIPVREDQGREIRRAFIPDQGHLFLSADYSQIELRLVADMASDPIMMKAFAEGADIHATTAAQIYHKKPEEVTADERRHAKTANFGILYGISAFGLASRLGIPRGEAAELIKKYFERFPAIDRYMHDSVEKARENGYTITVQGRRRLLPDINSKNPVVRGYAERNAINAPIQGTAADIIKTAMVAIDRRFADESIKSKMIMQIHDELNFDVVPEELPKVQSIVEEEMENAYGGRVRLTASSGVADNWLDAH